MDRRDLMKLVAVATVAPALGAEARTAAPRPGGAPGAIRTRDGAELFVRSWGAGRPVLFLAGWALPSDFWSYQMVEVARQGFRAVAYDRRGHGRSSDPGRGYDIDTLADDLARIIDGLGLSEVTLVGHSMAGGEIARYFTRHGGAQVARVALVGTITPCLKKTDDNPGGLDPRLLASLRKPLAENFPAWIDANARPFFTPGTASDMIAWGKALMLQSSLLAVTELARANAEADFRRELPRIDVPTLIVHGGRDASAPLALTGVPTSKLIPQARLSVYEDAPHGLPLTHVARLNAELLGFLPPR